MNTHELNSIPKDRTHIIITSHCIDRVMERFHLKLRQHEKESIHHVKGTIRDSILKGSIDRRFEFSPFYYNKVHTKYSQTIMIKTDICYFIGKYDNEDLIIKTAVRRP
jgi:hypothetical protein